MGADSSLLHRGQAGSSAFVVWLVFQMVRCWRGGEWWVWCSSWSGDVVRGHDLSGNWSMSIMQA